MTSSPPLVVTVLRRMAAEAPLRLTVRGECMAPLLDHGQQITVAGARRYWPGDVVAFEDGAGSRVVHRVIGFRRRGGRLCLQTRADASGTLDPPVERERVIGRVVDPAIAPRRLRSLWRFARLWAARRLPR